MQRKLILSIVVLFITSVTAAGSASAQAAHLAPDLIAEEVIAVFGGKSFDEIYVAHVNRRPQPPFPILRQLAISDCHAKLPIVADPVRSVSLRLSIDPVLALFRAEDRDLILFRGAEPNAFNLPGIAVGLSTGLIDMAAGEDDLIGIAAHELAHELFVDIEHEKNFKADLSRQRQVELMCDAVAVAVIIRLGKDPATYAEVITKILNYSPSTRATNNGFKSHPALASRLRVITALSARAPSRSLEAQRNSF
ncbi:MAG: M48 family metalloprotease [Pyrinomonadaceae bacterium]